MTDKLAWFPFYIDAWETDPLVRAMGPVARAYFMILLMIQWREGVIPESRKTLQRLLVLPCDPVKRLPCFPPDFSQEEVERLIDQEAVIDQVLTCFKSDNNGGLINSRLDHVRKRQLAVYEAKSKGGKNKRINKLPRVLKDSSIDLDLDLDLKKIDRTPQKRATQLPTDFTPNEHHRTLASEFGIALGPECEHFKEHHGARGSTFKDWNLAFNTWLRKAKNFQVKPRPTNGWVPPQNVPKTYVSESKKRLAEQAARKEAGL